MVGSQRATIKDVAAAAGVGVATVSRVLSGSGSASAQTRARVVEAARRLDYRPSAVARNLKLRRSGSIGLLVPDITNTFHARLADGVLACARSLGEQVVLAVTGDDPAREAEHLEALAEHQVDGIIAIPTCEGTDWVRSGLRMVFVDRAVDAGQPTVLADDRAGARAAVDYLVGLGHRRIGFLGAGGRRDQFREAMDAIGHVPDDELIVPARSGRDSAYAAAASLFQRRPDVTALVTADNILGEAAVLAARELDMRIPADVSVIMFDDEPWAELCAPPLTVVARPAADMGYRAAELLLRTDRRTPPRPIVLPTELLVRGSCGPPGGPSVRRR